MNDGCRRATGAILASLTAWFAAMSPAMHAAEAEYVPGEAIVVFKESATLSAARRSVSNSHATVVRRFAWLSAERKREHALVRSESRTTAELIAELRRDPRVETAEPNYRRRTCATYTPNDPRYGELWGLRNTGQNVNGSTGTPGDDIGFSQAWPLSRTATGEVVVAVIDTGCDFKHPDLASNIWRNANEIPGNGLDDDGNGYIDDYHGFDFASTTNTTPGQDADPMDGGEHGTHVCGTIAATASNSVGIVGVNPFARLMIVKASADGSTLSVSSILASYDYVATMKSRGVNVVAVNASYGGGGYSSAEFAAISELGQRGIVFCAAAGNNGTDNDLSIWYPASYALSNIIAVAATDANDALASFSNYGATSVDVAAPGENILSCRPTQSPLLQTTAYVVEGAFTFSATGMTYAGVTTGLTATAYDCAYGAPGDFPAQVSNIIALIKRGPTGAPITFAAKISNAMSAGAVAAIVYNNVAGGFAGTLQTGAAWIPAVSVSQADGQALTSAAPVTVTLVNRVDASAIYQFMGGTSMATPHVAGAVAFLAMNFPEENVTQRIARVTANVTSVPALAGKVASGGRLSILRAIDTDSDALPDWWEKRYFGNYTNGNPFADSNGNGTSDIEEWSAGRSPTYLGAVLSANPPPGSTTQPVVRWSSETGNVYRVERSTNLMAVSGGFVPVAADLWATPPSNAYTDVTASATGTYFYRVELQP